MHYLKRKIDAWFDAWKANPDRKPVLLKGARQVGKTEAVRHFAEKHYRSVIEINFALQPEFKQIVSDGYRAESIFRRISALNPAFRFPKGKTLLFLDEIQEFPDIATSFKSLKSEGCCDVIASGSMLGVQYKNVTSIPVGFKTDCNLSSLDFEEFLWACGYEESFVEEIYGRLHDTQPFDEMMRSILSNRFMEFCLLGGMPEIVRRYVENGTFEGVLDAQRQLFEDYRADVRKYAQGMDQTRILNVMDHVAQQLAKENKKFQISKVSRDARFKDYRGCVEWLKDAGIINLCHAMNFPELPVKGNYDDARFKIYMADTGLLVGQLDDESQYDLRANRNLNTYKGGLYENIVGEALSKNGAELVYYRREDSTLEMDFFLRTANRLVPVEVKAGSARAKSLRTLITSDRYPDISWGVKFIDGNVGFDNHVLTLPHWSAFLLRRLLADKGADFDAM